MSRLTNDKHAQVINCLTEGCSDQPAIIHPAGRRSFHTRRRRFAKEWRLPFSLKEGESAEQRRALQRPAYKPRIIKDPDAKPHQHLSCQPETVAHYPH